MPVLIAPIVAAGDPRVQTARPWLAPLAEGASTPTRRSLLRGNLIGASMAVELLIAGDLIAPASLVMYFVARGLLGVPGAAPASLLFAFGTSA